ncbi:vomeronasal type-2 receptor 1-like [Dendropsophus ebraccatus]|uniref:vomeronasal type-2 receptor 1-like n=1 Tax=Dendropsophus ebraccatus TaxID=150705 RepID=UPI00383135EC
MQLAEAVILGKVTQQHPLRRKQWQTADIQSLASSHNLRDLRLYYYMRKLHLRQLFFDENGDPPAVYDIVNWQLSPEEKLQQVKVGSYDTSITIGTFFTINTSLVQWGTGHHGMMRVRFMLYILHFCNCIESSCRLTSSELTPAMSLDGKIIIGAVFPVYVDKTYPIINYKERPVPVICKTLTLYTYQWAQALHFAVEEITPMFFPNITLGFQIFDSCIVLQRAVSGILQLLSGYEKPVPNYRCKQDTHLAAVIGDFTSTNSISLAHILGLYRYPQISHYATSPLLSDRMQFRSFFRIVPSDAFQSWGLSQLMLHFGWTWIGLVALDDDYGQQAVQLVKRYSLQAGACVAFTENIISGRQDRNAPHIAQVIKDSTATVIVFFSTDIDLSYVLDEMLRQNVIGKVLIASEAWATSPFLSVSKYSRLLLGTIGFALPGGSMQGFRDFLNKINPSMIMGNQYIKRFWEQVFGCKFQEQTSHEVPSNSSTKECTGQESLKTIQNNFNYVSSLQATYNVYLAVHAIAKALSDLGNCKKGDGPFPNGTCADIKNFKPWQLLHYMKKLRLNMSEGRQIFFDENGDPPAVYDIVNWQLSPEGQLQQIKKGSYDTSVSSRNVFTINTSHIQWGTINHETIGFFVIRDDRACSSELGTRSSIKVLDGTRYSDEHLAKIRVPVSVCSPSCPPGFRKAAKNSQPLCCFQCIPCPHGEISNHTDSLQCIKCSWDMWPNPSQDLCVPKTQEFLSYEDPLGVTLMASGISSSFVPAVIFVLFIHYRTTPIVRANNYSLSCFLLLTLSFCFLCSLVFIGYPKNESCLLRQVTFGIVFALCVSCILAKTIMVVIAFKATRPDSQLRHWTTPSVSYFIVISCILIQSFLCIMWLTFSPPFLEVESESNSGVLIIQCNEGSPLAFWSMLGYLGLLAFISFIVAFLARRLPDSFNEAKFITFSMLAFLSVWVSYIPASLSYRGKYMVAMEIFAIQSSTWGLVICMFLPKCFIILVRPNMNSKEKLMFEISQFHEEQEKNSTPKCVMQVLLSKKLLRPLLLIKSNLMEKGQDFSRFFIYDQSYI